MTKQRISENHDWEIEVSMGSKDCRYRDILSPAQQGMVDNGGYFLEDELHRPVDIDSALPKDLQRKKTKHLILHFRPIGLPRIWIGYYEDFCRRPLFCFLTADQDITSALEKPIRLLTAGGFAVLHFRSQDQLGSVLSDEEYIRGFDLVALVADPGAFRDLHAIRHDLISKRFLSTEDSPFACVYPYQDDMEVGRASAEAAVIAENGILPATVNCTLGAEVLCEEIIYTLSCDGKWPVRLNGPQATSGAAAQIPHASKEELLEAVHKEKPRFYARLGSDNTDLLRDFMHTFKDTPDWPEAVNVRRLINENHYLGGSNLAAFLAHVPNAKYVKKILDLGRCSLCFGDI